MEEHVPEISGPSLSLSCLRLLVPPIRLVSAAIWQTVIQKAVLDYGVLEEFVYMVTDLMPQLLKARQRAELIFGLRARLILELCRAEETSDSKVIQPHLDRMQLLLSMWDVEIHNADVEVSNSHFMSLVQTLLRDPGERDRFFQDVFPEEFGPVYDKAIQTLMWHFLSRLEELLPVQTVQQVAALLTDSSSVLQESMGSVFHLQELKPLLECQKDASIFEDNDPSADTCILPALFLPPAERAVLAASELAGAMAEGDLVYTVDTGLGVEVVATEEAEIVEAEIEEAETEEAETEEAETEGAETEEAETEDAETQTGVTRIYIGASGNEEEAADGHHWLALGAEETALGAVTEDTPSLEVPAAVVTEEEEEEEVGEEMEVTEVTEVTEAKEAEQPQDAEVADGVELGESLHSSKMECFVVLQRLNSDGASPARPVRRNRGLKMKMYLKQKRKASGQAPGPANVVGKTAKGLLRQQASSPPAERPAFYCTACKKEYRRAGSLLKHKCPNQSPSKVTVKEEEGLPGERTEAKEPTKDDPARAAAGDGENQEGSGEAGSPVDGPPEVFLCPHCSVEFKCKQTFRFHLRNICYSEQQVDPEDPDDPRQCFSCDECSKAFRYKSTLDSHKHTHNPLYCDVCMKLVRDAEALAMHKQSHTPFQCNLCEENFRVFKALHKHYVDAHDPRGPFDCGHCSAACGTLKRLIRHEWKHTGHQPFQCPRCPKRFRSYSDVLDHQKKHTKAYPFLCWECGKKFRHNTTLTRHMQRDHQPGQPPREKPAAPARALCPCCSKSFTTRQCLLRHVDFYHKGLAHPCLHCGKGFSGKDALARHMLIHTGEKPFKCDDCGKCFRSPSERKVHSRYHTGERPFKCKVCDKGFVQSCFLTLHMRTHTGERPYLCSDCPKAFTSLHGLKRHKRLVHA